MAIFDKSPGPALPDPPLDANPRPRRMATALFVGAAVLLALLIWRLDATRSYAAANYIFVILIGVATGATELMSRFRDRPFDALVSQPGLFYMAINGGAGALGLYLLLRWDIGPADPAQQVLLAGVSAMAVFRSGVFTTRIGGKDVNFGPDLVIRAFLDVLDREYDRERAFRRAQLISALMGGLDFTGAKESLSEVCFSLLQNVRPEERTAFASEMERIAGLPGMSDEARAMALGLSLMGIVGEDTLRAAGNNLGSTIFRFQPLSQDILTEIAKPSQQDVIANLFAICNGISHKRAQLKDETIEQVLASVLRLESLPPASKAMLLAYVARQQYGEKALVHALRMLPNEPQSQPIPAAPPPPPPAPTPAPAAADPQAETRTENENGGGTG
jgi:hypothetical protein